MLMQLDLGDQELKKYVFAVYILQALSFLFLVTSVAGVIINYIKDDDVRGSWLESHFIWQKRTFWYGLLWITLGYLTWSILISRLLLAVVPFWLIYRIAKGWVYLVDGKELYTN
jgi:uncharacterized membrane protein